MQQASLSFTPATPFIGQPFTVAIEVAVSPGIELEQLEISGLPDSSRALFTNLARAGRRQQRGTGAAFDILRYTIDGRGLVPFAGPVALAVSGIAVERVSGGFFSHTRSFPVAFRTSTMNLEVRELPAEGRPPAFSGAIGQFSLSVTAMPQTVAPGDIITLTCTLSGNGWLADAGITSPDLRPNFKTYPPQITKQQQTPPSITMTQVVIPLNTNATAITVPPFIYFDPLSSTYNQATAPPIALTFAVTASNEPAVKRIDTTPAPFPSAEMRQPEITIEDTVTRLRPMLPLAAALLLAVVTCAAIYHHHRLFAWLCAIAIMAAGIFVSRRLSASAVQATIEIGTSVTCRLAPSPRAMPLFDLHPGDTVTPLERTTDWLRINSAGREAWLPANVIKAP